jgi:DNA-binding protein HU-beta
VFVNKADVVDRVAGSSGLGRQQVESVIDAFVDTVKSAVKSGDRIAWPGFGSFSSTSRKARTGRNPRTGAAVKIPASKAVKFGPSSALKDFLNPGAAAKKAGGSAKKGATSKASKKASGSKAPAKRAAASKAPAKKAPAKKAGSGRASAAKTSGATKASAKRSASAKKATKARSR